jgi:DNA-binding transcriptional ArsR family regulator
MGSASSSLARKIINTIIDKEKYPKQIASELKENEQKIYYHIRNLERAGIIKVVKQELVHGTLAKFYRISEPAFVVRFKELVPSQEVSAMNEKVVEFLRPFIIDGKLDAKIIVGSPDPHGPEKARSRDGYYGIDLALFFGTFLNYVPEINVRLDTETKEDELKENLILIGGPVTNRVTERFNKHLPVNFAADRNIYSKISKTTYSSDETGLIVKIKNPFNPEKSVLVVAGKRFSGTRAAIMAFLKGFKQVYSGNRFRPTVIAKVVEGLDMDSDGVVDAVEFRE